MNIHVYRNSLGRLIARYDNVVALNTLETGYLVTYKTDELYAQIFFDKERYTVYIEE